MKTKFQTLVEVINPESEVTVLDIDLQNSGHDKYAMVSFQTTVGKCELVGQIPCLKTKLHILLSDHLVVKEVEKRVKIQTQSKVESLARGKKKLEAHLQSNNGELVKDPVPAKKPKKEVAEPVAPAPVARVTMQNMPVRKKTRRIKCPVDDVLITSEEFHRNKELGKYAGL